MATRLHTGNGRKQKEHSACKRRTLLLLARGDCMYVLKGDVEVFGRMECTVVISWNTEYSILIASSQIRKHLRILVENNVLE